MPFSEYYGMEPVTLKCNNCGHTFSRSYKVYRNSLYKAKISGKKQRVFCSHSCFKAAMSLGTEHHCSFCGNIVIRTPSDIKNNKHGKCFCNCSCAASYNNRLRRKSRRSKCECKLSELLKQTYPSLDIIENDKAILDGFEVDIVIPSLRLGIEWNGIVHFKPIYGEEKLHSVRQRDAAKLSLANDKGINLIVISDFVSTDLRVAEAFIEIKNIIDNLINLPHSS